MLGHPIGEVRRDQRQRDLDLRIAGAMAHPQADPAHRHAEQHLAGNNGGELACGDRQREHSGRNRGHREAIQDQRRGVVRQTLALKHHDNSARQSEPSRDRQRCDDVRRRDNGAEQESDAPRQADQIMRRGRNRDRGKDHAADRQQDDRTQVVLEFAPAHGDAGGIDQWRQYQQQHEFGRQLQRGHSRHKGQRDAGQQQQDRGGNVDPPRQKRGTRQHGEQNQKDLECRFHRARFLWRSNVPGPAASSMPQNRVCYCLTS